MPWNGIKGRPWEPWELDILLTGRTQDPPVPYKTLLKQLPSDRTWKGAARVVYDYGLSKTDNRATARVKYRGREEEILALLQICALDRKLCQEDARKWLHHVKDISLSRSSFNKRINKMGSSKCKKEREVHDAFKENGRRVASLNISMAKRKQYREGKSGLIPGGKPHVKNPRGKGEGQDQGDPEEVRVLLRSAGDAGHGAERHA